MTPDEKAIRSHATAAKFPSSCWTEIFSLKGEDSEATRQRALSKICETYWFPLYAFARHRGVTSHDAEDAVQSFFTQTGDREYFSRADQEKGKLRTFILTGFTRHLKDLKVQAQAQKRGGGTSPISINTEQAEEWLLMDPGSDEDPTRNFERHWAGNIMRIAIEQLRSQSSDARRFQILSRFLNPETCHDFTIREAAEDIGISNAACEKAVQRLRQDFRLNVREQVASTLENPNADLVMEEMLQLQKALASA